MTLTPARIGDIAAEAGRLYAGGARLDAVVRTLRDTNPGLPVTGTFASAMAETPYLEGERFSLFLVDGRNHCWEITADPATASGLVIAERDDDA